MILEFLHNKLVRNLFQPLLEHIQHENSLSPGAAHSILNTALKNLVTLSQNLPLTMAPPLVEKVLNFVL